MVNNDYLLFIDDSPVDENLKKYFSARQLKIIHQTKLFPCSESSITPYAILIHWSVLQDKLKQVKQFYSIYNTPLIIINDKLDEKKCISVLEAGADAFLIKPLTPPELYARVKALNRRIHSNSQLPKQEILLFSNWRLLVSSRQLFKETNEEVILSTGEYELLYAFIQRPKQILDREFLSNLTKKCGLDPFDRRIDVQISRLRQKIEINAKKPELIQTVRNKGYLFTAEVKQHELPND